MLDLTLGELFGVGSGTILAGLTLIQISPIKVNPWSALAKSFGRAINAEVIAKLDKLEKEVAAQRNETTSLRNEMDERAAKDSRVRILRFGDEILHDKRHSKEHFDQILQDITEYDQYCEDHKDFKNDMTVMTTAHIRATYSRCLQEHSFLQEQ